MSPNGTAGAARAAQQSVCWADEDLSSMGVGRVPVLSIIPTTATKYRHVVEAAEGAGNHGGTDTR